ncbi:hypothetical protein X846_2368 [Listeria monocytogenes Lm_1886]|nr:hypothetical protein M637_01735 [Listeria monocytogenes]EXL21505.1 hypothetical protein X846_2368 [Listeria monocytogenes Lm_1886]
MDEKRVKGQYDFLNKLQKPFKMMTTIHMILLKITKLGWLII